MEESINLEKLSNKDLLEKYFYLASKFDDGLDDFKLDKFFVAEDEILRRMGSNER